jgi:hypothetical protein
MGMRLWEGGGQDRWGMEVSRRPRVFAPELSTAPASGDLNAARSTEAASTFNTRGMSGCRSTTRLLLNMAAMLRCLKAWVSSTSSSSESLLSYSASDSLTATSSSSLIFPPESGSADGRATLCGPATPCRHRNYHSVRYVPRRRRQRSRSSRIQGCVFTMKEGSPRLCGAPPYGGLSSANH